MEQNTLTEKEDHYGIFIVLAAFFCLSVLGIIFITNLGPDDYDTIDFTTYRATITVDGNPYYPKAENFSGTDFYAINTDGILEFGIHKGKYGKRKLSLHIDGIDEPLVLCVRSTNKNERIILDVTIAVDSKAKQAKVTGTLTFADMSVSSADRQLSIDTTLDMGASDAATLASTS